MTLYLLVLSYFITLLSCSNIRSKKPVYYDFKAIFLTICYLYLIGNAIVLDKIGNTGLSIKYVLYNFIFYFLMFFTIKIRIPFINNIVLSKKINFKIDYLLNKRFFFLYFIVLIFYFIINIYQKKGFYIQSVQYRQSTSGLKQYIDNIMYYFLIAPIIYIFIMSALKNKMYVFLSIFILIVSIYSLTVSRTAIIDVAFAVYYGAYKILNKKINIVIVIIVVILSIIAVNSISHVRNIANINKEIVALIKIYKEHPELVMNVFSSGEFINPSYSLINIINARQYNYAIIFKDVSTLIPKIGNIQRWLSPAEEYMKEFYYDLYIIGHGYGFSNVALGYWWLGIPGIIIYGVLSGLYFNIIYAFAKRNSYISIIFYISIFHQFFNFARGVSLIGFSKNYLIMLYIPLIIGINIYYIILKGK